MTTLKLDKNNNLVVDGNISVINGLKALAQDIKTIISLQPSEYIYNIDKGVDWIKYLKENDILLLLSNIEQQIYTDTRVNVVNIDINKDNGTLILKINTTANEEVIVNVN